jgi:hypothetical protein
VSNPRLWQITDAQPAAAQLLASGADAFRVLAVDAGRVAVLRPDGTLVILNEQGQRVSAFNLGSQNITAARLTKSTLVALRGSTIEVRDATNGTLEHRWRTAESDAPVTLEDADGNFAVYTAGIAIHLLRLSDGRDRTLKIPNEGQPAHAQLEAEGLYCAYNETGSTKPGRVAFVPSSELKSQ